MLTELDIINDMLRATGTSRLTAHDSNHPSYEKALDTLTRISTSVQAMGLWFNTTYPELTPTTDGEMILPSGTIHCDPIDVTHNYSIRRRKLYNLTTRSFKFDAPERFKIVQALELEDMPYLARDYIRARAKYEFYVDEEGSDPKLTRYMNQKDEAWVKLYSEDLKNRDTNYFNSSASRRLLGNTGGRLVTHRHFVRPQE